MIDNEKIQRPLYYCDGDYEDEGFFLILAEDKRTILAKLYDGDDTFNFAEKNAPIFANSYEFFKALEKIKELIDFKCRDLANPHPENEFFSIINKIIEDVLDIE